jgi:ribosomal protein L23
MLISARITEKATDLASQNVFVFNVKNNANKRQIIEAVKALYKVTPVNVRMVKVTAKEVRHARIGVVGTTGSGKKAYVQLKKGDTISLM